MIPNPVSPVTTASSALEGACTYLGVCTKPVSAEHTDNGQRVRHTVSHPMLVPALMTVTGAKTYTTIQANLNQEASPLPGELFGVNDYQEKGSCISFSGIATCKYPIPQQLVLYLCLCTQP